MYRIGQFSQLSKVTVKALRYYDEVGLLRPASVDAWTGYRYFETEQLIPLQRIVALRQAGLSIEEVSAILSGQDERTILAARRVELQWELSETRGRLDRLESILHQEDIFMNYQATVRNLPACTIYYKEGVLASMSDMGAFIVGSADECRAANPGIKCLEPDYCFVTYVAPEYKEHDVGIMYAQAVTAPGVETETIKFKELPSVEAVCVYHKGPYSGLGEAYAFSLNWLKQNGYETIENPRECYIDGCWNKDNPEEWLTELQFPVKKR